MGSQLTMRKRAIGVVDQKKKSDKVRVLHKRKSYGVRVDHEKDRWGESSPLERAMG